MAHWYTRQRILFRLFKEAASLKFTYKQRFGNFRWLLHSSAIGCSIYFFSKTVRYNNLFVYAAKSTQKDEEKGKKVQVSHREERFNTFASILVEGEPYMTPQDFLLSITEESPKIRVSKKRLSLEEAHKFVKNTPSVRKGKPRLFHSLQDKGLISYTEYLFLLGVLTKPRSGFRIAFNMFDRDGNHKVDRDEFRVLVHVICGLRNMVVKEPEPKKSRHAVAKSNGLAHYLSTILENIIATPQKPESEDEQVKEEKEEKNIEIPTTLMMHFFGRKGKDTLKFEDFQGFMDSLQSEVLELEFNEFSHGFATISEESFARILLRYTSLTVQEHELYLERLRTRIPEIKGIHFNDFQDFCLFLNNLNDFALAVKIYSWANQPISEEEFKRAVKACTDKAIDDYLVHIVFCLFDIDGDGRLSDREFLSVMKDRLHRGFKTNTNQDKQSIIESFQRCMKETAQAS